MTSNANFKTHKTSIMNSKMRSASIIRLKRVRGAQPQENEVPFKSCTIWNAGTRFMNVQNW